MNSSKSPNFFNQLSGWLKTPKNKAILEQLAAFKFNPGTDVKTTIGQILKPVEFRVVQKIVTEVHNHQQKLFWKTQNCLWPLGLAQKWLDQICQLRWKLVFGQIQVTQTNSKTWKITTINDQLRQYYSQIQTELANHGLFIILQHQTRFGQLWQQNLRAKQNLNFPALHQRDEKKAVNPQYEKMLNILRQSKEIKGKIIDLFLRQQYRKNTPTYYFLTIENHNGVYNLTILKDNLTVDQLQSFQVGSWWNFTCAWNEKNYKIIKLHAISPQILRTDNASEKRIEFHIHSKMSALDGIGTIEDYLLYANAWNHPAIAFTDHENVHAFAECNRLQNQFPNLKIIYGCEFNYTDLEYLPVVINPDQHQGLLTEQEFVFLDLETTGLIPEAHHIIEFAAIVIKNGVVKERLNFFIQTAQTIPEKIWNITQIDQNEFANTAIPMTTAFPQIQKILANRILVAHNAQFDLNFLRVLYANFKVDFKQMAIDTLRLSHVVNPKFRRHTLEILAYKLKIFHHRQSFHRAIYDTKILVSLFDHLVNSQKYQTLADLIALNQSPALLSKAFPYHINVLVKNQTGLKALYKLISLTHTSHLFNHKPLLTKQLLTSYRSNLLVGAGCYNSEIFQIALSGTQTQLVKAVQNYDYIEIQPLEVYDHFFQRQVITVVELTKLIQRIINVAQQAGVLVIASGDVHYLNPEDRIYRDVLVSNKMLAGLRHPLYSSKQKPVRTPLQYFRSTNEMKVGMHFLGDSKLIQQLVVTNCHLLNDQITKVTCFPLPIVYPVIPGAGKQIKTLAIQKLHIKYGKKVDSQVAKRLQTELDVVIKAGYATIYLIAYQLTNYSLLNGFLFSSRGSVGSSFLAYCLNITEVNPLPTSYLCKKCYHFEWNSDPTIAIGFDLPAKKCPKCQKQMFGDGTNIHFSAFLGFDYSAKPDIDLNFSSWFQEKAQKFVTDYLTQFFGINHVFRAGTISTIAGRSAYSFYRNYVESELNDNEKQLKIGQKEQIIFHCTGIKRTTGQHPGGLMIIPESREIYDYCPFNYPSNNSHVPLKTTHFDYQILNEQLLKIDILGHDDPTGLKILSKITGCDPAQIPFNDSQVIQLFSNITILNIIPEQVLNETTGALGLPEYGTNFVRKILKIVKVTSFKALIAVSGLSHGTNVWESNAKDLILIQKRSLDQVIACRDDILAFLIEKGLTPKTAYAIMRKVKYGKGLNLSDITLLKSHHVPDWYIDSCRKITYLFPRAHATAYAIMAYRFAWFKLYYPPQFYAMYFTIRCAVFDLSTIVAGKIEVLKKYKLYKSLLQNRFKAQTVQISSKQKALIAIFELALEMFARKIKMINLNLQHSAVDQFLVIEQNNQKVLVPPFTAIDGLGLEVAQRIVQARELKIFVSQEDFKERTRINQTLFEHFKTIGFFGNLPVSRQLEFTW